MLVALNKKFWNCGEKRQGLKIAHIVNVTLRNADCLIHASGNWSRQHQIGEILELCEISGVKAAAALYAQPSRSSGLDFEVSSFYLLDTWPEEVEES